MLLYTYNVVSLQTVVGTYRLVYYNYLTPVYNVFGFFPFFLLRTQRLPWFTQSHTLVDLYLDYLSNLLSAQVRLLMCVFA